MSGSLRLYTSILFGFEYVVRSVPAIAWDDPSQCEGWTAREVAGHAMGVVNNSAGNPAPGDVIIDFSTDDGGSRTYGWIAAPTPLYSIQRLHPNHSRGRR